MAVKKKACRICGKVLKTTAMGPHMQWEHPKRRRFKRPTITGIKAPMGMDLTPTLTIEIPMHVIKEIILERLLSSGPK